MNKWQSIIDTLGVDSKYEDKIIEYIEQITRLYTLEQLSINNNNNILLFNANIRAFSKLPLDKVGIVDLPLYEIYDNDNKYKRTIQVSTCHTSITLDNNNIIKVSPDDYDIDINILNLLVDKLVFRINDEIKNGMTVDIYNLITNINTYDNNISIYSRYSSYIK